MSNPNATWRTVLRWTHLLTGFLIGVFVYTPAHDNDAFVLLVQAVILPAVTLTGVWMWQQARLGRLYRSLSQGANATTKPGPKAEAHPDTNTI